MKILVSAIWRLARVAIALGASGFLASLVKMPQLVWVAPVINAIFKAIRDKYPKTTSWIPL
jgi:hypothetical protein